MLELIDYGGGNLGSMMRCLERLAIPYQRVGGDGRHADLPKPSGNHPLLFPGVGAFGAAMHTLRQAHLDQRITHLVKEGVPYLGICIGLQVLFEYSEEAPEVAGLGLLPGVVKQYRRGKVPQIGWNRLYCAGEKNEPSASGLTSVEQRRKVLRQFVASQGESACAYFVNSYYPVPADASFTLLTADYHGEFCAAAQWVDDQHNITAFQFHPEKSGGFGHQLIQEWANHVV